MRGCIATRIRQENVHRLPLYTPQRSFDHVKQIGAAHVWACFQRLRAGEKRGFGEGENTRGRVKSSSPLADGESGASCRVYRCQSRPNNQNLHSVGALHKDPRFSKAAEAFEFRFPRILRGQKCTHTYTFRRAGGGFHLFCHEALHEAIQSFAPDNVVQRDQS